MEESESVIVIENFNALLKEILVNYKENSDDGLITGYVETQETYELFMSYVSALGYCFSVRSSHSRGRRPKTDIDERFLFQYGGGKDVPPIEFFGPLFSIKQVIHMVCAFGSKYYKKKRKNGALMRKPRNLGVTKKLDCPAKLSVRCIQIYPDFHTVSSSKWSKRVKTRDRLTAAVKSPSPPRSILRYYIASTPEQSHNHARNHPFQKPVLTEDVAAFNTFSEFDSLTRAAELSIAPTDHTYHSAENERDTESNVDAAGGNRLSDNCGLENLVEAEMYVRDGEKLFEIEECEVTTQNDLDSACDNFLNSLKAQQSFGENAEKFVFQDEHIDVSVVESQNRTKRLQERLRSQIRKLSNLTYLCKNDSILEKVLSSTSENCAMLEGSWVREGSLGLSAEDAPERVLPLKRRNQSLYRFPELLKGWKSQKLDEAEKPKALHKRAVIPLRYPELLRDWKSTDEDKMVNVD